MAVAAENGAPKTELQELQMKSNQVTDEVYKAPLYIPSVPLSYILLLFTVFGEHPSYDVVVRRGE